MRRKAKKNDHQFKPSRNKTMSGSSAYWYRVLDQRDAWMQEGFAWRNLFIGKRLGHGVDRCTYEYIGPGARDGEWIVKIEETEKDGRFQNVNEWNIWEDVKGDARHARWFAPCHAISPCGTLLIMSRTRQRSFSQYPARIPAFFNDLQYRNFGWIGQRFVCHDYGILGWNAMQKMKNGLVKADWYGDDD